jgi:hypothetical protein
MPSLAAIGNGRIGPPSKLLALLNRFAAHFPI